MYLGIQLINLIVYHFKPKKIVIALLTERCFPCFRSKSDENVLSTNENGEQRHLRIGCISGSDEKPNFASLPHHKKNERLMTTSMIGVRGFGNKSEEHLNGSARNGSQDTLNENRGRHSNFRFGRSLFPRSSRKGAWVKYLLCV